jgi:hypothetical protein
MSSLVGSLNQSVTISINPFAQGGQAWQETPNRLSHNNEYTNAGENDKFIPEK